MRKCGRAGREELLKLEAYYARFFLEVYFRHLCKRRGKKVDKRWKRYALREKKDEVNRRLNIAGTLLAKRFWRRYHFPLEGRFFYRKPVFDFLEFLRPYTYLIVYNALEYGIKRLIRSVKRFLSLVEGYCNRLVMLCKFKEKERQKGDCSSFNVISLLFLSANITTNVDPSTHH